MGQLLKFKDAAGNPVFAQDGAHPIPVDVGAGTGSGSQDLGFGLAPFRSIFTSSDATTPIALTPYAPVGYHWVLDELIFITVGADMTVEIFEDGTGGEKAIFSAPLLTTTPPVQLSPRAAFGPFVFDTPRDDGIVKLRASDAGDIEGYAYFHLEPVLAATFGSDWAMATLNIDLEVDEGTSVDPTDGLITISYDGPDTLSAEILGTFPSGLSYDFDDEDQTISFAGTLASGTGGGGPASYGVYPLALSLSAGNKHVIYPLTITAVGL